MVPAKTIGLQPPSSGFLPKLDPVMIRELSVPMGVLAIVITLITPLPSFVLDLLIVTDIMMSVVVLMVAMYIKDAVEFNVFPTTLLLLTLFRLALNISSTRLILMNGNSGTSAAGEVIQAFGNFVVGGNYIIGTVIFLVLIAIQYVVINHGAVRISEVTARFTLDALPGKQMSIDADLNAGLIDENTARARRKHVASEAEFYGAMDGASRFTQRDAVASILITGINIIAGFLIGVFQHGMDFRKAIETYTVLTIGDGLVTVIPALMISISGGMIVTRSTSDARLGSDFHKQLFSSPQPLMLASGVIVSLAAFPGLPKIPFLLMGAGMGYAAWTKQKKLNAATKEVAEDKPVQAKENIEALLRVDILSVEVGLGLLNLVQGGTNSILIRKVAGIRKQLATDLGFVLPAVRVCDNVALRACEYVISIKGAEVARYELPHGFELAIPGGKAEQPQGSRQTVEPAFGIKAWWIPSDAAEKAGRNGFTIIDRASVLGTHLSELVRKHAYELVTRQETKKILDRVAIEHPKVVEELVPKLLPAATVQRVIQNLLREQVAVRDAASILEALGEAAGSIRNPVLLTEFVRQSIRRSVVRPYLNQSGELPAYYVDRSIEQMVEASSEHGEQNSLLTLPPQAIRDVVNKISRTVGTPEAPVVLLTSSGARYFIRQMLEATHRNVHLLSHNEIPPEVRILSLGTIQ